MSDLVSSAIAGRLRDHESLRNSFAVSVIAHVAGLALLVFLPGFLGLADRPPDTVMSISLGGVAGPTTQSLISKRYGPDEQGAVQGALTSLQSLTGIFGPVLSTWVFGYFTSPKAPVQIPGASFLLGAILIGIAALLAVRALRQEKATTETAEKSEATA